MQQPQTLRFIARKNILNDEKHRTVTKRIIFRSGKAEFSPTKIASLQEVDFLQVLY